MRYLVFIIMVSLGFQSCVHRAFGSEPRRPNKTEVIALLKDGVKLTVKIEAPTLEQLVVSRDAVVKGFEKAGMKESDAPGSAPLNANDQTQGQ